MEGPISYELMARDTIAFLEEVVGGPAFLAGHSDALVALVVVLRRPDLVRLVFASGVFHEELGAGGDRPGRGDERRSSSSSTARCRPTGLGTSR